MFLAAKLLRGTQVVVAKGQKWSGKAKLQLGQFTFAVPPMNTTVEEFVREKLLPKLQDGKTQQKANKPNEDNATAALIAKARASSGRAAADSVALGDVSIPLRARMRHNTNHPLGASERTKWCAAVQ